MSYIEISTFLMLVFTGLWAGGILIYAVERVNLWRRMPLEQYVVDFRRSVLRVDPMMPIFNIIAGVATIVFAQHHQGLAQTWAWIALGCMLLVIVASIVLAEPINSKFRNLPEGQAPAQAEQLRSTWRRFHLARTAVALFGLASVAAAITFAT